MIKLKYCPRTKHSPDMALKKPHKRCSFKVGRKCSWHPCHGRYCEANKIPNTFGMEFECVLGGNCGGEKK